MECYKEKIIFVADLDGEGQVTDLTMFFEDDKSEPFGIAEFKKNTATRDMFEAVWDFFNGADEDYINDDTVFSLIRKMARLLPGPRGREIALTREESLVLNQILEKNGQ